MKTVYKTIAYVIGIAGLFLAGTVSAAGQPIMTTSPILAGSLTTTSVVVNGIYQNSPSQVYFEYGTNTSFGNQTSPYLPTNTQGSMTTTISGLNPGTTYYYRAVGVNGNGTGYGINRSFTTMGTNPQQTTACNDGYDNDGDGRVDMTDPGCSSSTDTDEYNYVQTTYACNNGYDDDGDGRVDMNDPGCSSTTDNDEYNYIQTTYACNNGYDDDGDGRVDMNDLGCSSYTDNDEYNFIQQTYGCNDGYDNDGDGYVDLSDPGCSSSSDSDEYNVNQLSVSTYGASNIAQTSATLNGYISAVGTNFASRYFQYGTSQSSLTSSTPIITISNTSGNVSETIAGLQPNTTYYFRLVGTSNNSGLTYGSVLNFTTGTNTTGNGAAALTTPGLALSQTSLRLNGLAINNSNLSATAWFEWGTTAFTLTNSTNQQSLGTAASVTFSDSISGLSRDTIYYYRAVVQTSNGNVSRGDIMFARTLGSGGTTTIITNNTSTTVVSGGTVRTSYIALSLRTAYETVAIGDTVDFTLTYKNITLDKTLNKVMIRVVIPKGITFTRSSQGNFNEADSTLTVDVGTLVPGQEGVVSFQGTVNRLSNPGDLLVTTAAIVYTDSSNLAQGDAIAYVSNRVIDGSNGLLAAALFGFGFLPTTFFGWLLLILLVILLVYFARKLYRQGEAGGHGHHVKPPAHD